MWSTISTLGTNVYALIFVLIVIGIGVLLIKKGVLHIQTKHVKIGQEQEKERDVIRRQTTFIHSQIDAVAAIINKLHPEFDDYRTMYICKCAEIELIRRIHYNHIKDSDGYKDDVFVALLALVQKKADADWFYSKDFEGFLKEFVDKIVKKLVEIRNF